MFQRLVLNLKLIDCFREILGLLLFTKNLFFIREEKEKNYCQKTQNLTPTW